MTDKGRHYNLGSEEHYRKNQTSQYHDEYPAKQKKSVAINSKPERQKPDPLHTKGSPGNFTTEKKGSQYIGRVSKTSPIKPVDNLRGSEGMKFNPETTNDRKYNNVCDKVFSPVKRQEKQIVPKKCDENNTQYHNESQNKTKLATEMGNSPSKFTSPGKYNDLVTTQTVAEHKHYSPSKFGYAGFESEAKAQYTPQDMQKSGRKDEDRKVQHEKGSIKKGDYGYYDTQYHDEFIKYNAKVNPEESHHLYGQWRQTSSKK